METKNKIQINQKALMLGAVSFLLSLASSALSSLGLRIIPAVFLCICAGCFAVAMRGAATKLCYLFVPASVICAFFITLNAYLTILSFMPFLTAIIICTAVKKKMPKIESILLCDLVVFAVIAIAMVAQLAFTMGDKFALSVFGERFNSFFNEIASQLTEILSKSGLFQLYSRLYDLSSLTEEQFVKDIVEEVIFVCKAITPSVAILLLSVISYLSILFYTLAAKISGMLLAAPEGKWIMVPSNISCHIFVVSVLAYFITSILSSTSFVLVLEMVALNLIIILLCPMLACGVRSIVGRMKSPMMRPRMIFVVVLAAIMLVFNFIYGLMFVALEGAWDMIAYYKRLKIWKENNRTE